jgi:copper chaperone CopZ
MGQELRLRIDGMTCLNCVTHVQKALEAVPGVTDVAVTQDEGATIRHNGAETKQLIAAVRAAGDYKAEVVR